MFAVLYILLYRMAQRQLQRHTRYRGTGSAGLSALENVVQPKQLEDVGTGAPLGLGCRWLARK